MRFLSLLSALLFVGLTGCDAADPAAQASSSPPYYVGGPSTIDSNCEATYTWNSIYGDDDFFGWNIWNNTAGAFIVSHGVNGARGGQQTPYVVVKAPSGGAFTVNASNDSGGAPKNVTVNNVLGCL